MTRLYLFVGILMLLWTITCASQKSDHHGNKKTTMQLFQASSGTRKYCGDQEVRTRTGRSKGPSETYCTQLSWKCTSEAACSLEAKIGDLPYLQGKLHFNRTAGSTNVLPATFSAKVDTGVSSVPLIGSAYLHTVSQKFEFNMIHDPHSPQQDPIFRHSVSGFLSQTEGYLVETLVSKSDGQFDQIYVTNLEVVD